MFYLLDETPPKTPEFGGYSTGLIDESNPAPEGAEEFENEAQLDRAIRALEEQIAQAQEKADQEQEEEDDGRTPPGQEGR